MSIVWRMGQALCMMALDFLATLLQWCAITVTQGPVAHRLLGVCLLPLDLLFSLVNTLFGLI